MLLASVKDSQIGYQEQSKNRCSTYQLNKSDPGFAK